MITRFRIEAKSETKEQVERDLNDLAIEIQTRLHRSAWGQDRRQWENTQDVISGKPGNYEGRQVYVYRGGQ